MMKPISFFLFVFCCCAAAGVQAQDPDIEADERAVLEDIYRSSDEAGETPTSAGERQRRSGGKRVSVPRGATRIGCICMDDSPSKAQSIGACSGHGGVRYWLYRNPEGDTLRVITGRHERHPQPLDSAERSEIVQQRPLRAKNLPAIASVSPVAYMPPPIVIQMPETSAPIGWGEIVMITIAGASFFFTTRLLLNWADANRLLIRHALRHLLRYRQRPPARKNRKIARKARV